MALAPTSSEEVEAAKETTQPPTTMTTTEQEMAAADLEDGEIEDDDEEEEEEKQAASAPPADDAPARSSSEKHKEKKEKSDNGDNSSSSKKKKKHLTEAEKSVLRLHKMERMEREKRDKYRRDQMRNEVEPIDDYAVSLEKALAKVLRKDNKNDDCNEGGGDDDEEAAKRGKKRKRKERQKQKQQVKRNRQESSSPKNINNNNNTATADDDAAAEEQRKSEEDSSDTSSEKSDARKRAQTQRTSSSATTAASSSEKTSRDRRERSRERCSNNNNDKQTMRNKGGRSNASSSASNAKNKRNVGICLYYLQGKCADDNCKFSHDCVQPLKLELCKFYQLDCCAKGDKCLYMHSDFPCRYYHTGIPCPMGDDCKFAHGGPLPESVRQILFKHIETAPKEILGNFPRLSRENAHMMITQAQKNLDLMYNKGKDEAGGGGGGTADNESDPHVEGTSDGDVHKGSGDRKEKRNRPSRWQDPEPDLISSGFGMQSPANFKDQDMRVNSNGDIDMRTLPQLASAIHATDIVNPNIFATKPPPDMLWVNSIELLKQSSLGLLNPSLLSQAGLFLQQQKSDAPPPLVDIEQYKMDASVETTSDTDIRPKIDTNETNEAAMDDEDNALHIVMEEEDEEKGEEDNDPLIGGAAENLLHMPKTQRDLFERIQQQQKFNAPQETDASQMQADDDEAAYQNDWYSDDEDDNKLTIEHDDDDDEEEEKTQPVDEVQAEDNPVPPDLSQIDIPAEVSKLLSSLQTNKPLETVSRDPRLARGADTKQAEPMTIYEQAAATTVGDKEEGEPSRMGRADVDLRSLSMPFKCLANYTPACEIDASVNAHPAMVWKVCIVDVPKPDYTGLKLSAADAHTSGDPRLRKIFRLSTEEKDSPASPSASPKATTPSPRVDPRRKRALDAPITYAQQLSTLQSSPFYQSLTSNQKLMLNQELASRNDQTGMCDPIVSAMLSNLGLQTHVNQHTPQQTGQAMSILNTLTQFNVPPATLLNNPPPSMGQGLLGPGPGPAPHMQDFPSMQFDPRAGGPGLLGNAPSMGGFGMPPGNYNDDFYEQANAAGYQTAGNGNTQRNLNQRRCHTTGGGGGGGGGSVGGNNVRNNRNNRNNYFRRQNKNRHRNNSPS